VLEERVGSRVDMQYAWSPVYVDAMIERDRDADATGGLEERLYVQQDANWNVTANVEKTGKALERYIYSPYGKSDFLNSEFTTIGLNSNYNLIYLYKGLRFNHTSALYDNRLRFISPFLQRFLQQDKSEFQAGYANFYLSRANNPTKFLDELGLCPNDDEWGPAEPLIPVGGYRVVDPDEMPGDWGSVDFEEWSLRGGTWKGTCRRTPPVEVKMCRWDVTVSASLLVVLIPGTFAKVEVVAQRIDGDKPLRQSAEGAIDFNDKASGGYAAGLGIGYSYVEVTFRNRLAPCKSFIKKGDLAGAAWGGPIGIVKWFSGTIPRFFAGPYLQNEMAGSLLDLSTWQSVDGISIGLAGGVKAPLGEVTEDPPG
jgi:RHS repeat-associated protein